VACNVENESAHRASLGKLNEREDLDNKKLDIGIILKWILQKYNKALTGYKM